MTENRFQKGVLLSALRSLTLIGFTLKSLVYLNRAIISSVKYKQWHKHVAIAANSTITCIQWGCVNCLMSWFVCRHIQLCEIVNNLSATDWSYSVRTPCNRCRWRSFFYVHVGLECSWVINSCVRVSIHSVGTYYYSKYTVSILMTIRLKCSKSILLNSIIHYIIVITLLDMWFSIIQQVSKQNMTKQKSVHH